MTVNYSGKKFYNIGSRFLPVSQSLSKVEPRPIFIQISYLDEPHIVMPTVASTIKPFTAVIIAVS
jgi:hypothetical protein